METWYEVPMQYGWQIKPVEVAKSTASSIWIGKHRRFKSSAYEIYVPTLGEAKGILMDRCEKVIKRLKSDLAEAENALELLK